MARQKRYPEPWVTHPHIWKTKAAFFSWLRGGLRRGIWEKFPIKLEFKNKNCFKPPEGIETRSKSGNYCKLSGKWEGKSKLEVDHIKGNVPLNDWRDLENFILHLVATEQDMQLVTKEAHKIKSYAERVGLTFEEAVKEKFVIHLTKLDIKEQTKILNDFGYKGSQISNAKKRRSIFSELVMKGEINEGLY